MSYSLSAAFSTSPITSIALTPSVSTNQDEERFNCAAGDLEQHAIQKLEPSTAVGARADVGEVKSPGEIAQMIDRINAALSSVPEEEKGLWIVLLTRVLQLKKPLKKLGKLLANGPPFEFDDCLANKKRFNIDYASSSEQLKQLLTIYGADNYCQKGSPLNLIKTKLKAIPFSFLSIHKIIEKHGYGQEVSIAIEGSGVELTDLNEAQAKLAKLLNGSGNLRNIHFHQVSSQQKIQPRIADVDRITKDLSKATLAVSQKIDGGKVRGERIFKSPLPSLGYASDADVDSDSDA